MSATDTIEATEPPRRRGRRKGVPDSKPRRKARPQVSAAIHAALKHGLKLTRVDIDTDGRISLVTTEADDSAANEGGTTLWDKPLNDEDE